VTGPPRPTIGAGFCSLALVCFSLLASEETSRASPPLKSESPATLLVEAREAAATIEDRTERSSALHPIVTAQIAADPAGARDTLKAFPRLPNKLNYFTALAAAYAAKADISETERIYAEIVVEDQSSRNGKLAAADALGQLAIAYANKGNLEEAFRTLERLKERTKQDPPAVVGAVTAQLAEVQAKHGDVAGGVETALSIAGDDPRPLMKIVGDRVRRGNPQEAQQIIARLEDDAGRYAQWGVIQAEIEQGRLIDAQVTASTIKPGHAKASALLELATYHRRHKGQLLALTLLQEAESSARSVSNEWARADMLRRIAAETAMADNDDRAIAIAKSIEQEGPRRSAVSDIASAQAKRGEFAGAFNTALLLKPTRATGGKVSDYDIAMSEILMDMVKAGKGADAQATAARFQDANLTRSWLYGGIAMAYADLGQVKPAKAALAVAETDSQRRARRKELRQIEDKIRFGPSPADDERLEELWKMERHIQRGLEGIAKALARKGDLTSAMAVAAELNDGAKRLELMKELSTVHVQAGYRKDTLRWARNLTSPSEKVFALVGIATALLQETDKRKTKPASAHKTTLATDPISPPPFLRESNVGV
jgi:tetratricopeptide (TPR) repeat protein